MKTSITARITWSPLCGSATCRAGSLEAVCADRESRDCAHRLDASLWNRSFEIIRINEDCAHGPHHLEPAPRELSLEAVSVEQEVCDCAHHSDATLWKCSEE
eukprot:158534-Amphidinium_carterae.1